MMRRALLLLVACATLSAQTAREAIQRTVGTNAVFGSQAQVPFQVALRANLKAVTVANVTADQVVIMLGYTSVGDGGAGQFKYDPTSILPDNGNTVIAPNVGNGRWLRISTFGASTSAGGTPGQIIFNDAGVQGGFDASGDATIDTATGVVTIADNAVSNAKLADVPTKTLKGNDALSTTSPEDLTTAEVKAMLEIELSDISDAGTIASQDADAVAITGGTIDGADVTGLPTPTNPNDAATKDYVDNISSGVTPRTAVRLATTANITLSGLQVVDGVTTIAADRVLVKNQTATEENGIYDAAAGSWSRSSDSNTAGELAEGYYYFVQSGSSNGSTSWFIQTAPTVLGSDPVVFSQFSASITYTAGSGLQLVGNQFSVNNIPTSITGTTNQVVASASTGPITLSLPQSIATSSSVQFGRFSVGTAINTDHQIIVGGTPSGAVSKWGVTSAQTVGNDVATAYSAFFATPGTAGGGAGLGTLTYYATAQGTFTGTVGTQIGFSAGSNLIGATNNYGFRGAIAAGSGRWNLYMDGTAPNYLQGNLGVSALPSAAAKIIIGGNSTGATIMYGTYTAETIQSGVTSSYTTYQSAPTTAASSFTLGTLAGFVASGSAPGAGSTVTNQYGFLANPSLTGATNNFGFFGNIAAGSNRWNFYAGGTAANYFAGATEIANTLTISGNSNKIATKNGLNLTVVNVKDKGAVGNGSTDDTSAINSAIAALTDYSALYFPPGRYRITAGLTALDGLTVVRVYGDGAEIFNDQSGTGGNTLVIYPTSDHVQVDSLRWTGSASVRGSGVHIRAYGSYSRIVNNWFSGCSDFGVLISNESAGVNVGSEVMGNVFSGTLGDGVHVGSATDFVVSNNVLIQTGDDSIGVIDDDAGGSSVPQRGVISGNQIYDSQSRGIAIAQAVDILVVGNSVRTSTSAAIEVGRFLSTTDYNHRIFVKSNKVYGSTQTVGPRGAIWMNFCNESAASENEIYDTANGSDICILDFNDLTIRGNTCRGSPSRSIATDDTTTANVAATWSGLIISGNVIQWNQANEAIYVVPASGKAITNLIVTSNDGNQLPSGNWIYYDRVTTGKVGNNTSRDGRAVAAGGTVSGVTAFNNN